MTRTLVLAALAATFSAGSAFAADVATYEPTPMAAPVAERFGWSGPYIGLFGGLATGETEYAIEEVGGPGFIGADASSSGFLGGVQAGWDWQSGNMVFGVVADIAATSYGPEVSVSGFGGGISAESSLNYLGTVRGRVGYAMDRTLFYAHGGFAYGSTEQEVTFGGTTLFEEDQGRTGWTAGVGFEFALTNRVSLGTEYAYVDLGSEEVFNDGVTRIEEDYKFHTLKALVNFRF